MSTDDDNSTDESGSTTSDSKLTARCEVNITAEWMMSEDMGTSVTNDRGMVLAFDDEPMSVAEVTDSIESAIKQRTSDIVLDGTDAEDVEVSVSVGIYRESGGGWGEDHAHSWVNSDHQDLTVEDIEAVADEWEQAHGWDVRARYRDYIQGVDNELVVDLGLFRPYGPLYDLVDLYVDHNDFMELQEPPEKPMATAAASLLAEGLSTVAGKNGTVLSEAFEYDANAWVGQETGAVIEGPVTGTEWNPDAAGIDLRNPDVHDWVTTDADDPRESSFPSQEEKREAVEKMVAETDADGVETVEDIPRYLRGDPFAVGIWLTNQQDPEAFTRSSEDEDIEERAAELQDKFEREE